MNLADGRLDARIGELERLNLVENGLAQEEVMKKKAADQRLGKLEGEVEEVRQSIQNTLNQTLPAAVEAQVMILKDGVLAQIKEHNDKYAGDVFKQIGGINTVVQGTVAANDTNAGVISNFANQLQTLGSQLVTLQNEKKRIDS
jgi:hypothetical protein